jgi:hypothetical protein
MTVKLDIGGGRVPLADYISVDRKCGREAFPLTHADGSVDEIHASHVLEHFSHRDTFAVLKDWVRVLKPGGRIRIAVPDMAKIAYSIHADGINPLTLGYLMGGHVDGNDRHGNIFDYDSLRDLMEDAGLENVQHWKSDHPDCASLFVSLNLEGTKRMDIKPSVAMVMQMPRWAFTDNIFACYGAARQLGYELFRSHGCFVERGWQNLMNDAVRAGYDYAVMIDFDSLFMPDQVKALINKMESNKSIDALVPVQQKRLSSNKHQSALFVADRGDGFPVYYQKDAKPDPDDPDLIPIKQGHLGLTAIRLSRLRDLPKPWFVNTPDENGEWSDNAVDADIYFWRKLSEHGRKVYLHNRVRIGHMQHVSVYPARDYTNVPVPIEQAAGV